MTPKQIDMERVDPGMDSEGTLPSTSSALIGTGEWWSANQMPHPPAFMAEQAMRSFERHHMY
ncbi:hypothetical protein [Paenibacillus sp. BR1-192]|uniref:hypothetical protein n=1 Tax=Paenibacillus sp. BR1-192 TaxID=3032287 RepID=UPI00240D9EC8|nr:hypothetical protein [Paenibacillus sp. BR1-192]WFB58540.1 hypothetical protein P0X86_32265 [Paenibacillus sp. BR1-192]